MSTHIAQAVLPLKNDAIAKAVEVANEIIAKVMAELETRENVGLPYPKSFGCGRNEFMAQKAKYDMERRLTVAGPWELGKAEKRFFDQAQVDAFIKLTQEDAGAQYDAFIAKLEAKIGDHVAATLNGNHVWGYSTLTVEKADGNIERWKTQQIVNVSKLAKIFNQWPTRKVK